MCGIIGFALREKVQLKKAQEARDLMAHRGPNQADEWVKDNLYLGHRRLSILDLSEQGRQPMVSEDGKVVITVNGEIYNFENLKKELIEQGFKFKSASDSEVVLHGYRAWGIHKLLEKIDGMYAFCVYDATQNMLYLVRDRAGIKPLYYSDLGGISWASELKSLAHYFGEDLHYDNTALYDFLVYRYIPSPKTMYHNINKLPPAHVLSYNLNSGGIKVEKYWNLSGIEQETTLEKAQKTVRSLLAQSIKEEMVADVPVGFFLSGGIDSSIVVAESAKLTPTPRTYSIGFGVKGFDETEHAKRIANLFKTKHTEKIITSQLQEPLADWLLKTYDEPYADTSALPTWHVSKLAKDEGSTVVLTGDGGDELFGGYKWYKNVFKYYRLLKILAWVPAFIWWVKWPVISSKNFYRKLAGNVAASRDFLQAYNQLFFTTLTMQELKKAKTALGVDENYDDMWFFRQHWKPELGKRKALQYLDFHTFMVEDVLTKVDRASMLHSIECRVPFLSKDLIEFAFSLPENITYHNGWLKGLLKEAYKDTLPQGILHRQKRGFSMPWHQWKGQMSQSGNLQLDILDKVRKSAHEKS